jgi:4-amino-4-deoxy-L-arabinose transferase-like glycosyltransferase
MARQHWPVVLVLAFALALRLWKTFPLFFYGDDAEYSIVAQYLRQDWRQLAYPDLEGFGPTPFVSQPPLMIYLFAAVGKLIPSMELAATLVCLTLGTLTCGLLYAIGVKIQGRTTGVLAGGFLAVMPYHLLLSRKAYLDIGLTFFMCLTILTFLVWLQRRTMIWALWTGLSMAATIMSKLPGILIVVPLLLGLFLETWHGRDAGVDTSLAPRARRRLLLQAGVASFPVVALGAAYVGRLWYLHSTADLVAKLGWQWGRVAAATSTSPTNALARHPWYWYLTSTTSSIPAQAGFLMSFLAILGIVYLCRRRLSAHATQTFVILAWPAILLLFFSAAHRKEWFYVVPLLAPTALLAAIPVHPFLERLRRTPHPRIAPSFARTSAFLVIGMLLIGATAAAQPIQWSQREVINKPRGYGAGVKEAALLIHERDPQAGQIGTLLGRFTLSFYNGQPTYHWFVPHDYINASIERGDIKYVVIDNHLRLPYERSWMEHLVLQYHGKLIAHYENTGGKTKVWVFQLDPNGALASTEPVSYDEGGA